MTIFGIVWLILLVVAGSAAIASMVRADKRGEGGVAMALLWFLLTVALLLGWMPGGIDPFDALAVQVGGSALFGVIAQGFVRRSKDDAAA